MHTDVHTNVYIPHINKFTHTHPKFIEKWGWRMGKALILHEEDL